MSEAAAANPGRLEPEDQARADFYALLARLFSGPPDAGLLRAIASAPPLAPSESVAGGDELAARLAAAWNALRSSRSTILAFLRGDRRGSVRHRLTTSSSRISRRLACPRPSLSNIPSRPQRRRNPDPPILHVAAFCSRSVSAALEPQRRRPVRCPLPPRRKRPRRRIRMLRIANPNTFAITIARPESRFLQEEEGS